MPPYTDENAEDAQAYLLCYIGGLLPCTNDTFDHAGYMVNRITDAGLTSLIQMRGNGSPRQEALERLSYVGPVTILPI